MLQEINLAVAALLLFEVWSFILLGTKELNSYQLFKNQLFRNQNSHNESRFRTLDNFEHSQCRMLTKINMHKLKFQIKPRK